MTGAWVHRDSEESWVDGRAEMIAGLLPMSAVECGDGVAELSDRALGDRADNQDRFLETCRRELCESAGDGLG